MYPERIHRGIEWTSVFETSVCSLFFVSKFSNFYTVQYRRVQYSTGIYLVPRYYSVVYQALHDITGQLQVRPILYTMVCGMWYVVCGMWYVVYGMWSWPVMSCNACFHIKIPSDVFCLPMYV